MSDDPKKRGTPWTPEEEQRLLAGFDQGWSLFQLAIEHDRSPGAITSRLVRLRRIVYDAVSGGFHKVDPLPWGFVDTWPKKKTSAKGKPGALQLP